MTRIPVHARPCPYCGHDSAHVVERDIPLPGGPRFRGVCGNDDCRAVSIWAHSEAAAVHKWQHVVLPVLVGGLAHG